MTKLTESAIEDFAIKLFEKQGYQYIHAPDIAPDGERPERSHYDEVILKDRLFSAHQSIRSTPSITRSAKRSIPHSFPRHFDE